MMEENVEIDLEKKQNCTVRTCNPCCPVEEGFSSQKLQKLNTHQMIYQQQISTHKVPRRHNGEYRPRRLYPRKCHGTQCIGEFVGRRHSPCDGYGKSHPPTGWYTSNEMCKY